MLRKTVEHCQQLRQDNKQLQQETDKLRQEISELNADIRGYQDRLPTSGIEVTKATEEKNTAKMFEDYVRARICENWKFWIFSLAAKPLFENFNRVVSTKNREQFHDSLVTWLDRHCTLVSLRPALLNCLRLLSTQTSVLSKPELLPEEALMAAMDDVFLVKAGSSDNDASADADVKLE